MIIFVIPTVAYAQTLIWQKIYDGAAKKGDQGFGVTIDNENNAVIVGSTYAKGKNPDVIIKKYSPAGFTLWTKIFDGDSKKLDEGNNIISDKDGNIFVAINTYTINEMSLSADYYTLRKYSAKGSLIWKKKVDSAGKDSIIDLASDGSNLYALSAKGTKTIITKYSGSGTKKWSKSFDVTMSSISVDSSGNLIAIGRKNGNLWIRKFSSSSILLKSFTGLAVDWVDDSTIDKNDSLIILSVKTVNKKYNMNISKYSSSGKLKWSNNYSMENPINGSYIWAKRITSDKDDYIYIVGSRYNGKDKDIFFRKISRSGSVLWSETHDGSGTDFPASEDEGWGIAVDNNNKVYVTGILNGFSGPRLEYGDIWLGKFRQ